MLKINNNKFCLYLRLPIVLVQELEYEKNDKWVNMSKKNSRTNRSDWHRSRKGRIESKWIWVEMGRKCSQYFEIDKKQMTVRKWPGKNQ